MQVTDPVTALQAISAKNVVRIGRRPAQLTCPPHRPVANSSRGEQQDVRQFSYRPKSSPFPDPRSPRRHFGYRTKARLIYLDLQPIWRARRRGPPLSRRRGDPIEFPRGLLTGNYYQPTLSAISSSTVRAAARQC